MPKVREYTEYLLEQIEQGTLDRDAVIGAFCASLSEDQVKMVLEANEMLPTCDECGGVCEIGETRCEECQEPEDEDSEDEARAEARDPFLPKD